MHFESEADGSVALEVFIRICLLLYFISSSFYIHIQISIYSNNKPSGGSSSFSDGLLCNLCVIDFTSCSSGGREGAEELSFKGARRRIHVLKLRQSVNRVVQLLCLNVTSPNSHIGCDWMVCCHGSTRSLHTTNTKKKNTVHSRAAGGTSRFSDSLEISNCYNVHKNVILLRKVTFSVCS